MSCSIGLIIGAEVIYYIVVGSILFTDGLVYQYCLLALTINLQLTTCYNLNNHYLSVDDGNISAEIKFKIKNNPTKGNTKSIYVSPSID